MLDKLFNKKDSESKVVKAEDTKKSVSSMRIVAKQTLLFPSMAKQLRSLSNVFAQYLKLHNVRPATPGPISDVKKSLSESKEIKVANIKVKKYGEEKKDTFLAGIVNSIISLIKGIIIGVLLAGGYIVYKLVEIMTPYVQSFTSKAIEGVTFLAEGIKNFFENVNWLDLLTTAFKKYWSFLSLGLISEEQVGNYIGQAGSFYKDIIKGIGGFIKIAVEWLAPRLQKIGRLFATNILGVDVDKLEEKRSIKETLIANAERIQKEDKALTNEKMDLYARKTSLQSQKEKLELDEKKRKEAEEKKKADEIAEKEKKKPFLKRLFGKEEKKELPPIEERSVTLPPVVEKSVPVTPAPAPVKPAPAPVKPAPAPVKPAPAPVKPVPAPVKQAPIGKATPIPDLKPEAGEPSKEPSSSVSLKSVVDNNSKFEPIDYSGLKPGFEKLLVQMATSYTKETGKKLLINSAYRSNQEQKELYDKWIASGKKGGFVAKPAAPLKGADGTSGAGSPHTSGTAIDIQAKGQMFGTLAGDVDNPKGWLEKFGLTRPVTSEFLIKQGKDPAKREDWHVTPLKSLPTPDGDIVPNKSGKPVDLATGKSAPDYDIGKSSAELAVEQRGQSKPQNPTVINARTTNNTVAETKKTRVAVPA